MNREFLYELLETASVSGFEEEIQRKVIKYARGFADEIYTDEIATAYCSSFGAVPCQPT